MASEIRVDKITSLSGVGTITPSSSGIDITGITTVATLKATTGIVTTLTATTGIVTTLTANTVTSLGDVSIADKIVHTGDTNTAIRFPAADALTIETGGSETFRITGAGATISTNNSNDSELTVEGTGGATVHLKDSGSGEHFRLSANGQASLYAVSSMPMVFYTGGVASGNERLRVSSSGKVRVGSGDATYPLEVYGADQQTILIGSTNAGGAYLTLDGDSNGDGSGGDYAYIGHTTSGNLEIGADNPSGNANIIFLAGNNDEKMRILSNGKVGINNNNPDDTLDVDGTAQITSNVYFGGDLYMYGNSYSGKGIFLGGNGSANKLDDYEEGTFTPTAAEGGSVSSYTVQRGAYTKIGDIVHCQIDIQVNGTASGDAFRVGGLPFTSANQATYAFGGAFLSYSNGAFPSGSNNRALFHVLSGSTVIGAYQEAGSPLAGNSTGMNVYGSKEFLMVVTYKVA
mgnify:CR=1 FL=1